MYLLGIDIGTSSTKSVIFDYHGNVISTASKEYIYSAPQPGYAEQNPEEWWEAVIFSIKTAVQSAEIQPKDIDALSLSGQMHGLVPLDKNGNVVRKAILHCDVRAGAEAEEIHKYCGKEFQNITYNPIFPGFQAVSLYWIKKHEPALFKRIAHSLCPKDYIRYRMTGKIGTEQTDASGTLLYDMEKSEWSNEIFHMLGLDIGIVPQDIRHSYDLAGTLTKIAADETGLWEGMPVAYGGADQAMQSSGNGVINSDVLMATIGTSGQVLKIIKKPVLNPQFNTHTFQHVDDGSWYALGAILYAGSTLNWFKRTFCENLSFEEMSNLAAKATPCCNGLVFLPCMGGERTPYVDPNARGIFCGITMANTKDDFIRAIMEGVSFAVKTSIEVIENLYGTSEKLICAGGGVKGNVWAQIQADIYGQDIFASMIKEQACLGAAMMAGIAIGKFQNLSDAKKNMCSSRMRDIHYSPERHAIYQKYFEEVYSNLYELNHQLFDRMKHY